jgi:hypothetical protein
MIIDASRPELCCQGSGVKDIGNLGDAIRYPWVASHSVLVCQVVKMRPGVVHLGRRTTDVDNMSTVQNNLGLSKKMVSVILGVTPRVMW